MENGELIQQVELSELINFMVVKNLIILFTLINKRKHNSLKISDYPVFYYKNKSVQQENIKKGIIEKVKSYYGIDIRDVYDFALPDVFQFIIDKKSPNKAS